MFELKPSQPSRRQLKSFFFFSFLILFGKKEASQVRNGEKDKYGIIVQYKCLKGKRFFFFNGLKVLSVEGKWMNFQALEKIDRGHVCAIVPNQNDIKTQPWSSN